MDIKANTMALAFEKRKGFIVRLTSKEAGLKSVSPIRGSGPNLRDGGNFKLGS